jgi:hypothetical protein
MKPVPIRDAGETIQMVGFCKAGCDFRLYSETTNNSGNPLGNQAADRPTSPVYLAAKFSSTIQPPTSNCAHRRKGG